MAETNNELLNRAYRLSGPDEAERVYDEWARTYDADTVDKMGYVAPEQTAHRLTELVTSPATVLDAGCGTGLVAEAIAARAELVIDGVDLSPGMLGRAAARGVYRSLFTADLTEPLQIDDDVYDALICAGTFTEGHVGPVALDEMARVVRPGGYIVATVLARVWESGGYRAHIDGMVERGEVDLREADERPYHEREGINARLCVLEVR